MEQMGAGRPGLRSPERSREAHDISQTNSDGRDAVPDCFGVSVRTVDPRLAEQTGPSEKVQSSAKTSDEGASSPDSRLPQPPTKA